MGRIERLGRILPGDGPVVPVARVRLKRRDERQDDAEADREDARREHAHHAQDDAAPAAPSVHVDVRV
jgi:hypothetical protein